MPKRKPGDDAATKTPTSKTNTPQEDTTDDPVAEVLPPQLSDVLRSAGVNPDDPNVTKALEISLSLFRGPLPLVPPPILREYHEIDPKLVSKIISWTETQAAHRRSLELSRNERSEQRQDRGQYIAAAVAIGGLFLSTIASIVGNPWAAGVIAIVSIGGPTAAVALARIHKT